MMKIKILTLVFFLAGTMIWAQHKEKRERIKALKTAYITEKLDLTPAEAEKFWPVYRDYEKKVHQIKVDSYINVQKKIRESGGISSVSDEEADKYLKLIIKKDTELIQTKEKLIHDLKKILPTQKILLLHQAERDFSRKLLEEYRRKRHGTKNDKP